MAGDWIKMRCDLVEDPAVISIGAAVGLDEFAVVGRLQALWSWADRQSRDGHARGVTHSWLDRKLQRDGFAQAMCDVGWLVIDATGAQFPNFDRHNGKTAKERALGAVRKQRSRADVSESVTDESREMSRTERDKSETREEKRREEQELPTTSANSAAPPDPDKAMWDAGKALFGKSSGSFIGKLVKEYGKRAVMEAIGRTAAEKAAEPKEFIVGVLRKGANGDEYDFLRGMQVLQ